MQVHQLQQEHTRRASRRVGRGGKRGKTAGRGTKGQKARAGHSIRPEMRDLIKKLPKRRGHGKNRSRTVNDGVVKPTVVNLDVLEAAAQIEREVTPLALVEAGLVRRRGGRVPAVKILSRGELKKQITVTGCTLSAAARTKIEATGGSVA